MNISNRSNRFQTMNRRQLLAIWASLILGIQGCKVAPSKRIECSDCHGSGKCPRSHSDNNNSCVRCDGSGKINCIVGFYSVCSGTVECICTDGKCGNCKDGDGTDKCGHCEGTGVTGVYEQPCSNCEGSGKKGCNTCDGTQRCIYCNGLNGTAHEECKGTGKVDCEICNGTGTCLTCNKTGKCASCVGNGYVITCKVCDGTRFVGGADSFPRKICKNCKNGTVAETGTL